MARKPDRNYYLNRTLPGGYHLQKFVGSGAFAYVYLASNQAGQTVAVKIQYNLAEDAEKRFRREIKIMRQLPPTPYCIRFIDEGTTPEGFPFLAMEFIDGTTLKDTLKHRPVWAVQEACDFMKQLCTAFQGLHQLGAVHRDVKPENIMVTRDWQVKLMDLGLVKDAQGLLRLFEDEDILDGKDFAENLDKGVLAGTPEYMAPEQFSDPSIEDESLAKTDTMTDVYSLGLIFYELLTGQKLFPFKPDSSSQSSYARSLLDYLKYRTNFADHELQRPQTVPQGLWSVLSRSLRSDPKLRQRNADELESDIAHFLSTGQGVAIEDEDRTSAIDLNSFLALHDPGNAPAAAPMAPTPAGRHKTMPMPPVSNNAPQQPMANMPNAAAHMQSTAQMDVNQLRSDPNIMAQNPMGGMPMGYNPHPHMQATNPYMAGQMHPPPQKSNAILWAVLVALIILAMGIVVLLLLV